MTVAAPAVPSVASTAASRAAAAAEPRDGNAAPAAFDSQLHAARQQHEPASANDASGEQQDERQPTSAARSPNDPSAAAAPAAKPLAPAPATVPAPVQAELADMTAADEPAPRREPGDEPAPAAADAMLALLGSPLVVAWPPAATAAAGPAAPPPGGKGATGDARAAAMLQLAAAAGPAAAPVNAAPLGTVVLAPAQAAAPAAEGPDKQAAPAHAAAVLPPPPAAAAPPAIHQLQLPTPPTNPSFAQDLGQQVAWLSGQHVKQARIRLHPEELGSLDVSVSVSHGRVDVVFSAQHAAAVPAVQQSLPLLDQMLARHGLSLGHTEVGQHDRGDRRGHAADGGRALEEIADAHGAAPVTLARIGLLDAFA